MYFRAIENGRFEHIYCDCGRSDTPKFDEHRLAILEDKRDAGLVLNVVYAYSCTQCGKMQTFNRTLLNILEYQDKL